MSTATAEWLRQTISLVVIAGVVFLFMRGTATKFDANEWETLGIVVGLLGADKVAGIRHFLMGKRKCPKCGEAI